MMKDKIFRRGSVGILSMLLMVLAAVFGADSAFAMSVETIDVNTDEGAGVKTAVADTKGLETQLDGAATGTHVTESGFEEDEIDRKIASFLPFRFPYEYYIVNRARQAKVKSYHPKHARSGSARVDVIIGSAPTIASVDGTGMVATISANGSENFKALKQFSQIFFINVPGYNGANQVGCLSGYVLGSDGSEAKVLLLNPSSTIATNDIPAGAQVRLGGTAGSESQMVVPPINYQPVIKEVYLQKKLANIMMTDEWIEMAKKAAEAETDLRNNALWQFKFQNAITHYLGVAKKITVDVGGDIGEENIYFEEGILNQVTMSYSYDPDKGLEAKDLHAIAALQFGKFSKNSNAVMFCSKGYIELLLNLEATKVQNINFGVKEVEQGFIIRSWVNNFGTVEIVYDPILDEIGYEGFAFVVDMGETTRYVKREQRTNTLDLKKTAEAREAKREMYSVIDCVALRGFNSVLVGPSDKIGMVAGLGNISDFITSVSQASELATPKTNGSVVYASTDITDTNANNFVLQEGNLYKWNATDGKWEDYVGPLA